MSRWNARGDARGSPAGLARLAAEAEPGQRGDHDVEGVGRVAAVRGGVGQRADQVVELEDRAGPAVHEDQR